MRDEAAPPAYVTKGWVDALDRQLGWNDRPRSARLLTAVLMAMRAGSAATHADADFPIRLCGTRCDDFPAPGIALEKNSERQFLDRVELGFKPGSLEHPEAAVRTVLHLLSERLGDEAFDSVCRGVPSDLPESRRASC
jgi:uncharacterized protein (DUF2267 family)